MEKFASTFKTDLSSLHKEFEIKKRTFDPRSQEVTVLKLPAILRKIYEVNIKQPLQMKIEQSEYGYLVKLNGDTLQLENDVIRGFYAQSVEHTSSSLLKVLYTKESKEVKTIVLVGGFALSPLIQNAVRLKFPDMTILMPSDPDLAVMKGSVLYGHCTAPILYMNAKYSYGIGIALPFDKNLHLDEKKFDSCGRHLCSDVFQQHIALGQKVRIGEFASKTSLYINRKEQRYLSVPVFLSSVTSSLYTTETTCSYLGRMKITLVSERNEKAPITIKMALTYAELVVEVVDEGSGRTIRDVFSDSPVGDWHFCVWHMCASKAVHKFVQSSISWPEWKKRLSFLEVTGPCKTVFQQGRLDWLLTIAVIQQYVYEQSSGEYRRCTWTQSSAICKCSKIMDGSCHLRKCFHRVLWYALHLSLAVELCMHVFISCIILSFIQIVKMPMTLYI